MTPYQLEVRDTERQDVTLVDLEGELDLTNAVDVERRLAEIADGSAGLVLDLNRVMFVDSAALHMLFRLARRHDRERRLGIILEPGALVARTLRIVGLHEVANVRATVEELVAEPSS